MTESDVALKQEDLQQFAAHGLAQDEVRRQWRLLQKRPVKTTLDRPCTVSDGIERVSAAEIESLKRLHQEAADAGRWTKFTPASGAASRMFNLKTGEDQRRFCQSFDQFAFAGHVREAAAARGVALDELLAAGRFDEVIREVFSGEGLAYSQLPKGLVEFHDYPDGSRTPFEEHLREAARCFSSRDEEVQCHFTVGLEHRTRFEALLEELRQRLPATSWKITFSTQRPSTDTIAMTDEGDLARDVDGKPLLRPGGHGALIENLDELRGDLIFVKNIDNVGHAHLQPISTEWIQVLGGYLVRLERQIQQQLQGLASHSRQGVRDAFEFAEATFPNSGLPFDVDEQQKRDALLKCFCRPLRVCGMVKNEGEPGGGPFWVRGEEGNLSRQIVEAVEVDAGDDSQTETFRASTHFNPVFMALAVQDQTGGSFDLTRYIDQARSMIASKPVDGRVTTVLERPGLWNGSMAGWNSVFLEIPIEVFSPVKTVFDLLRPQHQPLAAKPT